MRIFVFLALGIAGSARADILEERISTGSNQLAPTPFVLNPAQNPTGVTLFGAEHSKRDDKVDFVLEPGNNQAEVSEKISHKDIVLGGQYPLGGASLGLQYSEQQRSVSAKHINSNRNNNEKFTNRDYRLNFAVDFTPALRGAFTFHHTKLHAELAGNFFVGNDDHTHYKGSMSGYGLGLNYSLNLLQIGLYSHVPMRGKAMVEGEQKIISEAGIYGLDLNFRPKPQFNIAFHVSRWSYKHDERDSSDATSPENQSQISLRGVDINQFFRKTMSYGFSGEFALTPMVFAKGGLKFQQGVFLFNGDLVPGDKKNQETRMDYKEFRAGVALRNKAFFGEFGLLMNESSQESFKAGSEFGRVGSYKAKGTGALLMIGGIL